MPDGSGVMLTDAETLPASGNRLPPANSRPGSGWPSWVVGVWQLLHVASVTRYFPRSAGVAAACDGCGVVIGLGIVFTRYSSGPGRLRFGTVFFTAGIVRR